MNNRRLEPPSGQIPPAEARLADGQLLDLKAIAGKICRRYRAEFPDEAERYGDAGNAWCVHDNQYILRWAIDDLEGLMDLDSQLCWLCSVLANRKFPVPRLIRNVEIAAEVLAEESSSELSTRLLAAAEELRAEVSTMPT